jgi:hypothetical protein
MSKSRTLALSEIQSFLQCSFQSLFVSALHPLARDWDGRRTLGAEELAGDVQGLAADNDNLLSVEQLLGDGAGKATEKVPLAVDDLVHKSARGSCAMWSCRQNWASQQLAATAFLGKMYVVCSEGTYDDRLECGHGVESGCYAGG